MLSKQILLDSLKLVIDQSTFVSIDQDAIENCMKTFEPKQTSLWQNSYPLGYKARSKPEDEIDFIFILGSQAFCYWGYQTKWTIDINGTKLDGWYGNIGAFVRAVENGNNLLDGQFLAGLTLEKTGEIFGGEPEIPMFAQRFEILQGIGQTLVEKYDGRFHNFFEQNKQDAFTLMEKMAEEFEGFYDLVGYKGKEVLFYKKLNLVLNDIHSTVEKIPGVEDLLGTADYKIPALMRERGILKYSDELAEKVDNRVEILAGSEMEVEIRAAMLWASNLIADGFKEKRGLEISSSDFQNMLWVESQDKSKLSKPYHLTKTIFY